MRTLMLSTLIATLLIPTWVRAQSLESDPRVAEALELVEAWVDSRRAFEGIPGISMAIVHDQKLIWSRGFGYARLEGQVPARPDTIYSICSISKLFTSISVMQLRDQGKLRLDDPLERHLPSFTVQQTYQDSAAITLQGVLTHSSGLPRESDSPYWTGQEGYPFPTRDEVIARLPSQQTLYPADTYSQYSNLGLTLAGHVVAAASKQPYAEYVQQHILVPLELDDTSAEIPRRHKGGRLATGYSARVRDGSRAAVPFYEVRGMAPAFGFASTVEDLAKFASWQFRLLEQGGTEVLAANTLKEMHRVHWLDPDWDGARGVGFGVSRHNDRTIVGHGGNCPGYRSQLMMSPADKIAVIFMTNGQGTNTGAYTRPVFDIVAPAIGRAVEAPGTAEPAEPDLRRYVGRYQPPFGGETQVLVQGGALVLASLMSGDPVDSLTRLRRMSGHVFRRVRDDGELGEEIVFDVGPDGRATRFSQHSNYAYRLD